MFIANLLDLYSLVVIGAVVVSWMRLPRSHPIAGVIYTLTEPALAPIRRALPTMGGLDFSPMVLLLGLQLLRGALF